MPGSNFDKFNKRRFDDKSPNNPQDKQKIDISRLLWDINHNIPQGTKDDMALTNLQKLRLEHGMSKDDTHVPLTELEKLRYSRNELANQLQETYNTITTHSQEITIPEKDLKKVQKAITAALDKVTQKTIEQLKQATDVLKNIVGQLKPTDTMSRASTLDDDGRSSRASTLMDNEPLSELPQKKLMTGDELLSKLSQEKFPINGLLNDTTVQVYLADVDPQVAYTNFIAQASRTSGNLRDAVNRVDDLTRYFARNVARGDFQLDGNDAYRVARGEDAPIIAEALRAVTEARGIIDAIIESVRAFNYTNAIDAYSDSNRPDAGTGTGTDFYDARAVFNAPVLPNTPGISSVYADVIARSNAIVPNDYANTVAESAVTARDSLTQIITSHIDNADHAIETLNNAEAAINDIISAVQAESAARAASNQRDNRHRRRFFRNIRNFMRRRRNQDGEQG